MEIQDFIAAGYRQHALPPHARNRETHRFEKWIYNGKTRLFAIHITKYSFADLDVTEDFNSFECHVQFNNQQGTFNVAFFLRNSIKEMEDFYMDVFKKMGCDPD